MVESSFQLRRLSKIKPILFRCHLESLIHAFITSCLDYSNSLLIGISQASLSCLQLVQNAAARFPNWYKQTRAHNPGLVSLHWLPIKFRIHFKMILFVLKSFNGLAPSYLSELLHPYMPSHALRSANQLLLTVLKTFYKSRGDRAFAVCVTPGYASVFV